MALFLALDKINNTKANTKKKFLTICFLRKVCVMVKLKKPFFV
jgi:hypothetical protein